MLTAEQRQRGSMHLLAEESLDVDEADNEAVVSPSSSLRGLVLPVVESKDVTGSAATNDGQEFAREGQDQHNEHRWRLPPRMWCRRHGATGRGERDWVERRLGIEDGRLVALYGKDDEEVCAVCDCRDVFLVDLRNPLGKGTPPPRAKHAFTINFKGGQTLILAAQSGESLRLWVCAIRTVSGASIQQPRSADRDGNEDGFQSRLVREPSSSAAASIAPAVLGNYAVNVYADGSKYAGEWKDGLWHGHGRLRAEMPHGGSDVYEGGFSYGEKDGVGSIQYSSGDSYQGEFKMGKKHGKGTYFQYLRNGAPKEADRSTLEQRLELRAFLGKAMHAYGKELQERYKGGWKDDRRHGIGIITEHAAAGAVKYKAVYEDGVLISKVNVKQLRELNRPHELEYSLSDMVVQAEAVFVPNFVTRIEGLPPFEYTISPALPEGVQLDSVTGEIAGSCSEAFNAKTFTVSATNQFGATRTEITIEVMSNPYSSGAHTKRYPDGSVYSGGWKDGLWHGEGRLDLSDGAVYEGGWEHGIKHGKGVLSRPDGTVMYAGEFRHGLFHGWGELVYCDGARYEGEVEWGVPQGVGALTEPYMALPPIQKAEKGPALQAPAQVAGGGSGAPAGLPPVHRRGPPRDPPPRPGNFRFAQQEI